MLVIANNLSFRNREFIKAVKSSDGFTVGSMAELLKKAGADAINVNLSLDGDGDDKLMGPAVAAVAKAGLPVFIDTRNPDAMKAGLEAAGPGAALNYISAEPRRASEMKRIARLAAEGDADLVVYPVRSGTPVDADERLRLISELMDMANAAGVPNERLIVDPVVLHLGGGGTGQQHALAVQQILYAMRELVEPPLRTTCWISNVSAGAAAERRPAIDCTFLAMLAGIGLTSAFLNMSDKEAMRTVRLIRALKNEAVFSLADAEL